MRNPDDRMEFVRPIQVDIDGDQENLDDANEVEIEDKVEIEDGMGNGEDDMESIVGCDLGQGVATEGDDADPEDAGQVEEGREAAGLPAPPRVSRAEREEHNKTHCPYRLWCPICVKGRGLKMSHRRKQDDGVE